VRHWVLLGEHKEKGGEGEEGRRERRGQTLKESPALNLISSGAFGDFLFFEVQLIVPRFASGGYLTYLHQRK